MAILGEYLCVAPGSLVTEALSSGLLESVPGNQASDWVMATEIGRASGANEEEGLLQHSRHIEIATRHHPLR